MKITITDENILLDGEGCLLLKKAGGKATMEVAGLPNNCTFSISNWHTYQLLQNSFKEKFKASLEALKFIWN